MIVILLLFYFLNFANANSECFSHDDPHMKTFDGKYYEFQYPGDQYIMYDDFSGTRVTASYQSCNYNKAFCNCAFYFKKGTDLVFVDFCSSSESFSRLIYGVSIDKDSIGIKGIKEMPPCKTISPLNENNENTWSNITSFLGNFKCARIQGSNYYDTYVIRTIERDFYDSVKVKFQINSKSMPTLKISPSKSSFENTGGICGMWDNSNQKELYVIDKNGLIQYTSDIPLARDFWKLHSRYNKDDNIQKRCPECNLMAERAIYCPCDDFDLFDITNYNIQPPNRTTYCKVPMFDCIKKYQSIKPIQVTTTPVSISTESNSWLTATTEPITQKPITLEEATEICLNGFMNNTEIANNMGLCLDISMNLNFCALDINNTGDMSFLELHIDLSLDMIVQNLVVQNPNCTLNVSNSLCPNSCSNNGVCLFDQTCLSNDAITENCISPVKCHCNKPFGGKDCSLDLSVPPNFELDRECCDLRNEGCDSIKAFGENYSTRDPIYVKIEYLEKVNNKWTTFQEITKATSINENTVWINLNKISELILYKNIHDQMLNIIADESLALVNIYINYMNSSFTEFKSFKLYDSKCRTCKNGLLNVLPDSCEINGRCFSQNESSPLNSNQICDPILSNNTWTLLDSLCYEQNEWTDWNSLNEPSGDGDLELFFIYNNECKLPLHVQIETLDGIPFNQTGQTVHLISNYGFMCLNNQNNNSCLDYKFRFCCPKKPTATVTVLTTTVSLTSTPSFQNSYPGLAVNYPINDLLNAGFQTLYEKFYSEPLKTSEILEFRQICRNDSILCAAGSRSGSNVLNLISCANCRSILTKTIINKPNFSGAAYWYLTENKNFGFSKLESIDQTTADYNDHSDNYRLSWHLDQGIGGWRVGNVTLLNLDNSYKKYIFVRL